MSKPTLTLDASEYRALLLANLARAHDFVSANPVIGEHLAGFCAHMDRVKVLASAWKFATPAVGEAQAAPPIEATKVPITEGNGAESKRRRGGWPKGVPRKQRARAEQVQ